MDIWDFNVHLLLFHLNEIEKEKGKVKKADRSWKCILC